MKDLNMNRNALFTLFAKLYSFLVLV